MLKRRTPPRLSTLSVLALLCPVLAFAASGSPPSSNLLLPPDASALLAFKSEADLNGVLRFSPDTGFFFCQWQGVQCVGGRAVRLVLEGLKLGGAVSPNSLTRLDQLRVLSLQNDSLAGPIPDLSGLINLKTLFLGHNAFTGSFPPSIVSLHRVRTLDLSQNALTGPLPSWLAELDRLYYLRLDGNRFNGTIPPLNQSSLQTFNVSGNNLTGAIPVTPVLARFELSSYSWNPGLCGEIINKECNPLPPFFGTSSPAASVKPPPPETALGQSAEVHGLNKTQPAQKKHKRTAVILGFSSGVAVLVCSLLCFAVAFKKQRESSRLAASPIMSDAAAAAQAAAVMQIEQENELEEKVKRVQGMQVTAKSGTLVFCAGEAQLYSLEQLMRGSAELLGRGTTGTTYKAVLDNGLIVSVKRMDGGKMAGTSKEAFERHMESVGGLRHPNLVPLRAYFQAKEERLLIYDHQPNGSLFSLIHGSKSARAKPLHWTSCLKIAEDVAQGLSYIHQAWRLVHGNLKSSNVLLGPDFEACLVDYCLSVLIAPTSLDVDDPDFAAYRAPESRDPHHVPTNKSDVYAYGTLLLELITSRPPSQHPRSTPGDLMGWVRSTREDDGGGGDDRLAMLLEIAVACSAKSPEQRPTMWQVLKMLQEIKEEAVLDDSEQDVQKEPC
ncbi:Protein kinase domain-containing protein [Psidium guajava]|nr:Protein kinase domain-containing protein [Psidium guajava]